MQTGDRLGRFTVRGRLGAGGMGEVWRAEDMSLGREVALKLLPEDFEADPERHARFEREARILASLNHPNIATLYGLEHLEGRHALVMELVEGDELSEWIQRGPLPMREAIPIAIQIAEALEAAHEVGIVHRDLKPNNIMLRPDGAVKVLDFGLAKAWEGKGGDSSLSLSPTMTQHATVEGVILGTAAYMSPEQARGKKVDRRADIWAFGVVLWEMLTGGKLFEGETVSDTLAAVLMLEPDPAELPAGTPPALRRLLMRCLDRDVKHRVQAAGELRIALTDLESGEPAEVAKVTEKPSSNRRPFSGRAGWMATGVLALVLVGAAAGWWRGAAWHGPAAEESWVFSPLTRLPGMEIEPSLSPDGRFVAYASNIDGDWDVYLLRVGGDNPINLTEDAPGDDRSPVYSPDGDSIAFQSDRDGGGLFVMGATGESVRRVTGSGYNPSWSPDGTRLVFAEELVALRPWSRISDSRLFIADLETGEVSRIPGDQDAVQPAWSPAGDWIAFWGLPPGAGQRDLWLVRPDGSGLTQLTADPALDWSPSWSADGRTLFFSSDRGGTLGPWSMKIDPRSGRALSEPRATTVPATWAAGLSLSSDGRMGVFINADLRSNIFRCDFDPEALNVAGAPVAVTRGASSYTQIDPSPDGRWVAATTVSDGETLTLVRSDGTSIRRLTHDAFHNRGPVWSPDGESLVFYSDRSGGYQLHSMHPDGSGIEQVTDLEGGAVLAFFSPDGRRLLIGNMEGDIGVVSLDGTWPIREAERVPKPPGVTAVQPSSWTADGRGVVFGGTGGGRASGRFYVYDLDAARYRDIRMPGKRVDLRFGVPVALDDGRHFLVTDHGAIVLLDTKSGRVKRLLEPPPGSRYVDARMGPGDRSIFFVRLEQEVDLWVARRAAPEKD